MYYLQKNLDTQQCKSREYELGVQLIAPGHESCQNLSRIVPEYLNQVLFWENLSFVELYKKILWNTTQVVKPNVRKWVVLFQSSSYSLLISTSKSAVHPPVSHIPVDGKFWSKAFEVLGKWVTVKKLVGLVKESTTHSRKWVACWNFIVCWLWTLFNWIQLLSKWLSDRCEPQLLPSSVLASCGLMGSCGVFLIFCSLLVCLSSPLQLYIALPSSRDLFILAVLAGLWLAAGILINISFQLKSRR